MTRRVAIVGAGAVSAYGLDWRGLGRALAELTDADQAAPWLGPAAQLADSHPDQRAAEVAQIPRPADSRERMARKLMSRAALLAALAARRAAAGWTDARDDVGFFLGVGASGGAMDQLTAMLAASLVPVESKKIINSSSYSNAPLYFSLARFGDKGLRACNPLLAFQLMNNFTLCHAAIQEGTRGPNAALYSRGTGTVVALAEAVHAIHEGACSRALAGGADSTLHPVTWAELVRHGRGAMLPGEGAGILALAAGGDHRGDALAWVERCDAYRIPPTADGPDDDDDGFAQLLRDRAAELSETTDLIVIAPWGPPPRAALRRFAAEAFPDARLVDVTAGLGECLAASPALAWIAAVDLLAARAARRAVIINAGVDGDLGVVVLSGPRATARGDVRISDIADPPARRPRLEHPDDLARTPVITGVGAVSAFGVGADALWDGLAAGRAAVGPITWFDAATFPARVAGQVPGPLDICADPALAGVAGIRDRKCGFGLAAAREAWRAAGCGPDERDALVALALGLEQAFLADFAPIFAPAGHIDWTREPTADLPLRRFRAPVDLCADVIRADLGLQCPNFVHVSACAAGALSVAHAASLIARGAASMVVTGAADAMVNPLGLGGMSRLGAPSPRADADDACRPFDRRRDGLAMGEGAAVFVVESAARAAARGARPLARILGWGSTQDAYKATAPRPDGSAAADAMRRALERAGLAPDDVGYINAHGTGTPLNDPTESAAIRAVFGDGTDRIWVSSIKGAVGHLMAASGALELAACLMAFTRDTLPGTAHLSELDPACPIRALDAPLRARVDVAMSSSFGFGGQNAVVVLGRPA